MRRSREMKDAKKRENEEREKERQAAKAAEKEKRKRKVPVARPGRLHVHRGYYARLVMASRALAERACDGRWNLNLRNWKKTSKNSRKKKRRERCLRKRRCDA